MSMKKSYLPENTIHPVAPNTKILLQVLMLTALNEFCRTIFNYFAMLKISGLQDYQGNRRGL